MTLSFVNISHQAGAIVIVDDKGPDTWEQALEWSMDGIQTGSTGKIKGEDDTTSSPYIQFLHVLALTITSLNNLFHPVIIWYYRISIIVFAKTKFSDENL